MLGLSSRKKNLIAATASLILTISFGCGAEEDEQGSGTARVERPVFAVEGGTYFQEIFVDIESANQGATIYFTTDGSTPDEQSNVYSSPIHIFGHDESVELRAVAVKKGLQNSRESRASYLIQYPSALAPIFSPPSGTFEEPISVQIRTTTENASIYYTLDQSDPSIDNGIEYVEPIYIDEDSGEVSIKAVALGANLQDSRLSHATYQVQGEEPSRVSAPTFDPPAGIYDTDISVTIEVSTPDVTIFFTTDGTSPTSDAEEYITPIAVSGDDGEITIKAVAIKAGMRDSRVSEATYLIDPDRVVAPVFSPAPGVYHEDVQVVITTLTVDATIFYTTDGSNPSATDEQYSEPIEVVQEDGVLTIRAIAIKEGMIDSPVSSATYSVQPGQVADLYLLSGLVTQQSGTDQGNVYVWLYALGGGGEADIEDLISPTKVYTAVPVGDDWSFEFEVEDGEYVIRSFRDAGGSDSLTPDALPTMGVDPQSRPLSVVIDGENQDGIVIELMDEDVEWRYGDFSVFTFNESAQEMPPQRLEGSGWVEGEGLCGGYHMRLQAILLDVSAGSAKSNLSAPRVKLPDDSVVTLMDDGGCGSEVGDNSSSSYDSVAGDGVFSHGFSNPDSTHSGTYTFFYEGEDSSFFHIEKRELAEVKRLTRGIALTSPTGASPNDTLTPKLSWESVSGDAEYDVWIYESKDVSDGKSYNTQELELEIPAANSLADGSGHCVNINASAINSSGDIYAISNGVMSCFVTCTVDAQDECVTVSGSITNNSGESGEYLIFAYSEEFNAPLATLVLPQDATQYSIAVLKHPEGGKLSVQITIDVDGSGDRGSKDNLNYTREASGLEPIDNNLVDVDFVVD